MTQIKENLDNAILYLNQYIDIKYNGKPPMTLRYIDDLLAHIYDEVNEEPIEKCEGFDLEKAVKAMTNNICLMQMDMSK